MTFDSPTTAVLSLDVQQGIFSSVPGADVVLAPAAGVVGAARAAGLLTLHIGLGFEPGYPEISPKNARFSLLKERGHFVTGSDSAKVHPAIYRDGDLFVAKHRIGAFSGNALEMILRAKGIETLVLFGIATSGIVLSTVRAAADLDFACVVVKDACFDPDPEVHRVLTDKILARQATVITAEAFRSDLGGK